MVMKMCPRCGVRKIEKADRYCDKCNRDYIKQEHKRYKNYNWNRSLSEEEMFYARFYATKEWINQRNTVSNRCNGLCLPCLAITEEAGNEWDIIQAIGYGTEISDVVHHIVELKEDYDLRLSLDNLITLCDKHHNVTHIEYKKGNKDTVQKLLKDVLKWYEKNYLEIASNNDNL